MFLLFLPTLAAGGFFSNYIQKYVNHSIEPCDDFYDHVCASVVTDDNPFTQAGIEQMKQLLRQVAHPEVRSFRALVKSNNENFSKESMQKEDEIGYEKFVGTTIQNCPDRILKRLNVDFLDGFEAYDGFTRLTSTPHYKILKKKITDILTVLKTILVKEFRDAPWTAKHQDKLDFLRNINLKYYNYTDLQLNKEVDNLKQRYKECLGITSNMTGTLSKKCMEYSMCTNQKLLGEIAVFVFYNFNGNAGNTGESIELSPMYYMLEEDNLPYMLGVVEFVIAHELGHVFFKSNESTPSNSECFRGHILKTCVTYLNNDQCNTYNESSYYSGRFGDDASDWIGMYAGLKALKQYFPKIFSDDSVVEYTPESAKMMKQFFYAHAIRWCSRDQSGGDKHSPSKIRVNGISSLFPEFSQVFQCLNGHKMAKSTACLPFAGVGAPLQKR